MDVFLRTGRLRLRRFTEADVDLLAGLHGDPDVMRYLTGRPVPREEVESETLPRFLGYYEQFDGLGAWAAETEPEGEFLGWFLLRPDGPGTLELGYRLHKSAWGKGYATEGSRALVDRAFGELGAERVVATTMTVNAGSRRVMEKVGLRHVRTFHQEWPEVIEGGEHGDVEHALTAAQWAAR